MVLHQEIVRRRELIRRQELPAVDAEELDGNPRGPLEIGFARLDVTGETDPGRVLLFLAEQAASGLLAPSRCCQPATCSQTVTWINER